MPTYSSVRPGRCAAGKNPQYFWNVFDSQINHQCFEIAFAGNQRKDTSMLHVQFCPYRYAEAAVAFMVTSKTTRDLFDQNDVADQNEKIGVMKAYTKSFFQPFVQLSQLEKATEGDKKVN